MARYKEREKYIHEPSTHEVFVCLSSMIKWSQILLEHGERKDYHSFLAQLIECRYFEERVRKTTIKQVSNEFKLPTTKVTKWLREIYQDILDLNDAKEELFTEGKQSFLCLFSYFDNSATITVGANVVPRVYEEFNFPFIEAKVGTRRFWVKQVQHELIDPEMRIILWLEGGNLNRFREMAVEEALFKGWISMMDEWHKTKPEIDEIIIKRLIGQANLHYTNLHLNRKVWSGY